MLDHWFLFLLVFAYGACVGSFLNVVIYRLAPVELVDGKVPDHKQPPKWLIALSHKFPLLASIANDYRLLSTPPSHCPKCEHKLAPWDNIPVLGWLLLRGRCRYCKVKISCQYPIIEAICGLIFAAIFYAYYFTGIRPEMGLLGDTWPVLIVHFVLLSGLLAATGIDAKHFIIPHSIPYTVLVVALVGLPFAATIHLQYNGAYPIPTQWAHLPYVSEMPWEVGFGYGGVIGLLISVVLLKLKWIPRSFDDLELVHDYLVLQGQAEAEPAVLSFQERPQLEPGSPEAQKAAKLAEQFAAANASSNPEDWVQHPFLRREIFKEILFLAPPTLGAVLGATWASNLPVTHAFFAVLGACLTGALVGAGLIWYIRVLGSLAFGKEAMGLGDVHLMLAIGAVLGWMDVTIAFFIAPFSGILAAILMPVFSKVSKKMPKVLPYGPHLAVAAVVMLLFRHAVLSSPFLGMLDK